ncbi:MAG: 4a-hydroxytetrahydrobiopterin dehydratase [Ignavibacterium sp.]|mgnify:CR=1 FL=1|jgi:4a-hydroxytetrahydrobiopterin dehydratase
MGQELLKESEIRERLKGLKGWTLSGKEIRKSIETKDFVRAMGLVNSIALLAERRNHHPDIDIRWNKVHLALSTHSAGGLTDKDFELASAIDQL